MSSTLKDLLMPLDDDPADSVLMNNDGVRHLIREYGDNKAVGDLVKEKGKTIDLIICDAFLESCAFDE
jgi:hypothetical protein